MIMLRLRRGWRLWDIGRREICGYFLGNSIDVDVEAESPGLYQENRGLWRRMSSAAISNEFELTDAADHTLEQNLSLLKKWGMTKQGRNWVLSQTAPGRLSHEDTAALNEKLEYLVKELGCKETAVVRIVQSHPPFLVSLVDKEIAPFMHMFISEGELPKANVRKMVLKYPPVVGMSQEFESTLASLQTAVGITRKDWVHAVSKYPSVLKYSNDTIVAMVTTLSENGFTKEDILKMVTYYPYVLGKSEHEDLEPQLNNLEYLGFSAESARSILAAAPHLIDHREVLALPQKFHWLSEELGIGVDEAKTFIEDHPRIFGIGLHFWKRSFELFTSFGMSRDDIVACFRKSPFFVSWAQDSMKEKFEFARDYLQKGVKDIVEFPDYFRYSLESRIMLRTAFLDSIGRDYTKPNLHTLLSPTRTTFMKRFGKKFPPETIRNFEIKWEKLTTVEKRQRLADKSYWSEM